VKKICARYLFGSWYQCSQFPSYTDSIYDAPSVCLPEFITVFAELAGGLTGKSNALQTTIGDYLFKNYSTNACERRCYQRYQNFSNEFYLSCQKQVQQYNKSYPFPALLTNYQQFRNQGCGYNPATNDSCYVQISTTFAKIQYANATIFHGDLNAPNIMTNYQCNYFGMTNTVYNQTLANKNLKVLQQACGALMSMGCCAGSGIALIQGNQIEAPKGKFNIVPPCLLNYIKDSCKPVHLNRFCTPGTIATQTSMQGYFVVTKTSANLMKFPNVYVVNSLLNTQGILATIFNGLGFSGAPYYMGKNSLFQIYIMGYAYYKGKCREKKCNYFLFNRFCFSIS
jgi:hypothetical protein